MNRIERGGERFFGGGGDKSPTYPMVNAGWGGGVAGGHTCPFFPCDLGGSWALRRNGKRGMMRVGERRDWTRQLASERWRLVLMS